MIRLVSFIILMTFSLVSICAADMTVNKAHLDNDISCADCHGTATPEKRASAKTCIGCHSEIPGTVKTYSDAGNTREVNIHNSHDGQLRCTLCHRIHEPSTLYCADCHHFEVKVP